MSRRKITLMFMFIDLLIPFKLSYILFSSAQTSSLVKVDEFNINVGYSINIVEDHAIIADNDGISIFDISDPTNVVNEQNIPLAIGSFGTHVVDGIAYAACATDGFYIINVTDISEPEQIANVYEKILHDYIFNIVINFSRKKRE